VTHLQTFLLYLFLLKIELSQKCNPYLTKNTFRLTKIKLLKLFRKIAAVSSEKHKKLIYSESKT